MSLDKTFEGLSPDSRVWIYQSNRTLSDVEVDKINPMLSEFSAQWVSHNQQLKAAGEILYNRFLVLMVDQTMAGASGCSIDSSVRFITDLGNQIGVSFFDRMTFPYRKNDQIQFASKDEFEQLFANGVIDDNTVVFDNLVKTKKELESVWEKPLAQSWHKRFV